MKSFICFENSTAYPFLFTKDDEVKIDDFTNQEKKFIYQTSSCIPEYISKGLGFFYNSTGIILKAEEFDKAREFFKDKNFTQEDADKLPAFHEYTGCISVFTFMQILDKQISDDAMTITPFSNLTSRLRPNPPLLSPIRFGALLQEARKKIFKKQKNFFVALMIENQMRQSEQEEKKRWNALLQSEKKRLDEIAKNAAMLVQPYLYISENNIPQTILKINEKGEIKDAEKYQKPKVKKEQQFTQSM